MTSRAGHRLRITRSPRRARATLASRLASQPVRRLGPALVSLLAFGMLIGTLLSLEPGSPAFASSISQTITFNTTPPVSPAVGSTFTLSASGGASGEPVVFSIDPTSSSVCSLAGSTLTFNNPGNCLIHADQSGTGVYLAASDVVETITVASFTPTISWSAPSSMPLGTALSSTELDATASYAGQSVPGSFTYSPTAGTVLGAGLSQTLSVTFDPTDTTRYSSTSATTKIDVTATNASVTFTSSDANAVYGSTYQPTASVTPSGAGTPTFSVGQSSPSGVCSYFGAAVHFSGVGSCILDATVANGPGVLGSTATQMVVVSRAQPAITWASPSPMAAGTQLTVAELDATANVPGQFTYTPSPGTTVSAGQTTLSVNFVPADSTNFSSVTASVNLTVESATTTTTTSTTTTTTTTTVPPPSSTTTVPPPSTVPPPVPSSSSSPPSGTLAMSIAGTPGIAVQRAVAHVQGVGFLPGSTVTVIAHSTPVVLGAITVNRAGSFAGAFALPSSLASGGHLLIVQGTLRSGQPTAQREPFSVSDGGLLGTIGSVPPGPLANDAAFVPTQHTHSVLATTAGVTAVVGSLGAALGGGAGGGARGGSGSGSGSGSGGGYLEDVELERDEILHEGEARGDRSRTWRLPFTHRVDHFSRHYPAKAAGVSPVAARVLVDGDYLRAMFGGGWLLLCLCSVGLGLYASASTGWYAIPPVLSLFLVILGLSVLDAALGYLAGIAFVAGALVAGHLGSASEIRTGAGVVLVWFAVPLAAAALRPLRRQISLNTSALWDRCADLIIGGFFGAWAAMKMSGAISGLAGVELPIDHDIIIIGWSALGFIALRILIETIAAHHYPSRLKVVHHHGALESKNLQIGISLLIQIALFIFISIAYMGSSWALYVGAAVFFAPLVPWLVADRIPKSKFITKWKPRGLVNWSLIIVFGVLLSRLLDHLIHSPHLLESVGFILLPLPVLVSWALELFEEEGEEEEESEEPEHGGGAHEESEHAEHGAIPALAFAGGGGTGTAFPGIAHAVPESIPENEEADSLWSGTSHREKVRAQTSERLEREGYEHEDEWSAHRLWLMRFGGVVLVVVSTFLVVTHIAGG